MSKPGALVTAVWIGLVAGLLVGGVGLSVTAATLPSRPCEQPGTAECDVELASNRELARLGAAGGLGLCLIGAGALIWLRRRGKERP